MAKILEALPRETMEVVAKILNANGVQVSLPWEGDLDDREQEIFDAIEAAVATAIRMDRGARR